MNSLDLLVADVSLPGGKSGIELAREIQVVRPQVKVVTMTGYNEAMGALPEPDPRRWIHLRKPIARSTLGNTISTLFSRELGAG